MHAITIAPLGLNCFSCLYWKMSIKIQSFYSFMSQKAQKRKSTWFVAKKCTWQCKILSMLQVAAQTDILDFNLKYFPSLFCYLEQRTVRNSRGPFPSMFSLMKWQVFVTQISQIFAIISDGSWTSVHCERNSAHIVRSFPTSFRFASTLLLTICSQYAKI